MNRALIIFVKEPDARAAKTRLAPALAPEERVGLYEAMLHDLSAETAAARCSRRIVCWTGEGEPSRLRAVFQGRAEWRRQRGADLGARMLNAFQEALKTDESAVLIGSDAPLLTSAEMDAAFESLDGAEIALAPCPDGGYGLIGARASALPFLPRLFENIPWSSADVLSETLNRLAELPALRYVQLPLCFDVDTPDDLRVLCGLLRGRALSNQQTPKQTSAFLRRRFHAE